jgi:hypothetical protein
MFFPDQLKIVGTILPETLYYSMVVMAIVLLSKSTKLLINSFDFIKVS